MKPTQFGALSNPGRQEELDLARGLAVFFMVAVHVLQIFAKESLAQSPLGELIDVLGGPPAAPVFLFLLGLGLVYSRHSQAAVLAQRGAMILALGYGLNFLRGSVPSLIHYALDRENAMLDQALYEFWVVDILQLAGLAFLFFAALRALGVLDFQGRLNRIPVLVLMAGVLGMAELGNLWFQEDSPLWQEASLGLFWGVGDVSFFPFFPWMVYPLAGLVFGGALLRTDNKGRFYRWTAIFGLVLVLMGVLASVLFPSMDLGFASEYDYYHHHGAAALVFVGFVLVWIGLLYGLRFWIPSLIKQTLQRWSSQVTILYTVHWVLIGFLTLISDPGSAGTVQTFLLFLGVLVGSDLLSQFSRSRIQGWQRAPGTGVPQTE